MASTEGRVAKPERRWDNHHGTPGTESLSPAVEIAL